MGIQGLLPLLKECQEASHIKEFKVRLAGWLDWAVPSHAVLCYMFVVQLSERRLMSQPTSSQLPLCCD